MRELLEKMISDHSGKAVDEVSRDIERDKILTAQGAVEYGLIDSILESLKTPRTGLIRTRAAEENDVRPMTSPEPDPVLPRVTLHLRRRREYVGGEFRLEEDPWHASVTVATC